MDPPQPNQNPTDEDNPAALVRMLDFLQDEGERCEINLSRLTDLIDCGANNSIIDENGKKVKVSN
jgi:hypothetical protein